MKTKFGVQIVKSLLIFTEPAFMCTISIAYHYRTKPAIRVHNIHCLLYCSIMSMSISQWQSWQLTIEWMQVHVPQCGPS